jgi:hypothetical protein
VVSRIDRKGRRPGRATDRVPVEPELQRRQAARDRSDRDRQPREVRRERGEVFPGKTLAIVLLRRGLRRRVVELGPRARRPAVLLVAEREVQQRAEGRIEPLALTEFVASFVDFVVGHEVAPLAEQRLGEDAIGRLRPGGRGPKNEPPKNEPPKNEPGEPEADAPHRRPAYSGPPKNQPRKLAQKT